MQQELTTATSSSLSSSPVIKKSERPSQKVRWTINIALATLVLTVIGVGTLLAIDTIAKSGLDIGAKVPDITGTTIDGTSFDSREHLGAPLMLVFWSPDCHACAEAYPTLQAIADDPASTVTLITVAGDTTAADTEAKMRLENLTFPTIVDENQVLLDLFKVPGYPHTYLINPDGTIDQVLEGIAAPDELDIAVGKWISTCARGVTCSVEE